MTGWLKRWFAKPPVFPPPTPSARTSSKPSHEIPPIEVKRLLDEGQKLILVDVRSPEEWEKASLRNALKIPRDEIYARYGEIGNDPSAEIVVFCHHGIESEQAMHQLWGLGFQNAKTMPGGIDAWSVEVDPKTPRY